MRRTQVEQMERAELLMQRGERGSVWDRDDLDATQRGGASNLLPSRSDAFVLDHVVFVTTSRYQAFSLMAKFIHCTVR